MPFFFLPSILWYDEQISESYMAKYSVWEGYGCKESPFLWYEKNQAAGGI